jgi:hypothetical protein
MGLTGMKAAPRALCQLRNAVLVAGGAMLFAACPVAVSAQGVPGGSAIATSPGASVNLTPKRITFDRPGKSATVSVASTGGTGGFEVEMIDRVMLPDGQIVPLSQATGPEAALLKSAKPYLVLTPRRIRMTPGVGQAIRVRAAATSTLAPGEYRTHLTVTGLPPADTGLTAEQAATQREGKLAFRINSVLAISIPVILRVGPIDVRAAIEHPAIAFEDLSADGRTKPVRTAILKFELVRLGANSLFGDVEVRGSKKLGGEPIGAVRGIGVYPEIERRQVRIILTRIPASGEQIDLQFRDDDTAPGAILSKASLAAP